MAVDADKPMRGVALLLGRNDSVIAGLLQLATREVEREKTRIHRLSQVIGLQGIE